MQKVNTFEGGTDGVAITTGNSGEASGTAFNHMQGTLCTFSNIQARSALSCRIVQPGVDEVAMAGWTGLGSLTTSVYLRTYIWIPSIPTSTLYIARIRTSVLAVSAVLVVDTSGFISVRDPAFDTIAGTTGTVTVATGQWVRVEWRVLSSTTVGEVEWRLYNDPDSATISDSASATGLVLAAHTDQTHFGNLNAPANYTNYFDDVGISDVTWLGSSLLRPGRVFKRFYGPALLTNAAADLYTVPAGRRAVIRHIHTSNPTASPVDLTLSIGTDAASTRLWDGYPVPADGLAQEFRDHTLVAGEKIQGFAGTTNVLNLTIDGYEESIS